MLRTRLNRLIAMLACALATSLPAQTHPAEPAVNLGDTSFLDGIAGPGLLVEEIADGAHNGRVTDASGATTPGASVSNSVSRITHIAWLSHRTLFGAWYGLEFVQAVAHVNAGQGRVVTGAGDLTVSPLILQWKENTVGPMRIVQRIVFDFDVPTGEYQRSAPLSLSAHAFDVHPYYAVTLLPARRLETSWRVHYLWNATDHVSDDGSQTASTQAGQAIHFNATAGYRLTRGIWIGGNGYYLDQITNPQINGHSLSSSPERVGAIGPGVAWDLGHWILYANGYHEVGALNRPEGNKAVLRMQWLPSRKGRQP